ncbi:MAG: FHA domain-containing protein [Pirellulales bacterium]
MFDSWRFQIRTAKAALRDGRLDEASEILRQSRLREYLPAKQLSREAGRRLTDRALGLAASGETQAGWRALESAESLETPPERLAEVRQVLAERGLREAEAYLAAGEPQQAIACLARLERRGAVNGEARRFRKAAGAVTEARRLCRQGRFGEAETLLAEAKSLVSHPDVLESLRQACTVKREEARQLSEKLHQALTSESWTAALSAAEALLEIAPDHREARIARRKAWKAVGMQQTSAHPARPAGRPRGDEPVVSVWRGGAVSENRPDDDFRNWRFLVWVDAVGGFLVCLGSRLVLGQPNPDSPPDVPLLADISRRHAVIHRDGEGYFVEPVHSVKVDGRPASGPTPLRDGSVLQLGENLRIRFRKPHALSATARLEIISHHKSMPSADAILLMADSCILGPGSHSHVVCRDWTQDVILHLNKEALHCRATGEFQIDGQPCGGQGPVTRSSQIEGEAFSLSLEPA